MKRLYSMILSLALSALLLGCARETGEKVILYYLNPDANGLMQETYVCQEQQGLAMVDEVVAKLKQKTDDGLSGRIPPEVEIQSYQLEDGILEFHFDKKYQKMNTSKEVLFRAGLVQTMVQLPDVSYVTFFVGEEQMTDSSGNVLGMMKTDDFLQNVGSSLKSYQTATLNLYFANKEGTQLSMETRDSVHYTADTSIEKLVVETLMKGTTSDQRSNTIASSVNLIGVTVRDGICYVNFDSTFLTAGYDQAPEVTIYSIVNSIVSNGTVNQVQILVDGGSDIIYKGTVDLRQPLSWKPGLLGGY